MSISSYLEVNNKYFCSNNLGTSGSTCDAQEYILFEVAAGFECPLFLSNSWYDDSACFLPFVACDPEDNVVEINLARKHLFGTISSSILQLTKLQILNFSNNHLYCQIPDGLSNMYDFTVLDISNNNFSGNVPTFVPNVRLNYSGNPFLKKKERQH
ncbi:hypothetical protein ACFE04_022718 [Oxalis oulophora]